MIEINGKKYPVYFGMRQVMAFSQIVDPDTGGIDYDKYLEFMHSGIKRGCSRDNVKCDLTLEDLEAAIDEDPALFDALRETYDNSKVGKHMAEKAKREEQQATK